MMILKILLWIGAIIYGLSRFPGPTTFSKRARGVLVFIFLLAAIFGSFSSTVSLTLAYMVIIFEIVLKYRDEGTIKKPTGATLRSDGMAVSPHMQSGSEKPIDNQLPFRLESSGAYEPFLLLPKPETEFYIIADRPFLVEEHGQRVAVPKGAIMFHLVTEKKDDITWPSRSYIQWRVHGNLWKQKTWTPDMMVETLLDAGDAESPQPPEWIADEATYTTGDFAGGRIIMTAGSGIPSIMPEVVDDKGYSSVTSQLMADTYWKAEAQGTRTFLVSPYKIQEFAAGNQQCFSARKIYDAITPSQMHTDTSDIGNSHAAESRQQSHVTQGNNRSDSKSSATSTDFPVQTGHVIDPLGIRAGNVYMTGDGDLTYGINENLSVSQDGLVMRAGGLTVSSERTTTNVLGMEVDVTPTNIFDKDRKQGKKTTLFGETKDDTEMTVLGPRKKKRGKGGLWS